MTKERLIEILRDNNTVWGKENLNPDYVNVNSEDIADSIIAELLVTDEEIKEVAKLYIDNKKRTAFIVGAKWMRDRLTNKEK